MTQVPTLTLDWEDDLRFRSGPGGPPIQLHSSSPEVAGPMQALAYALMGCMAMDVVEILRKGRHDLKALTVTFDGERADDPPRRYVRVKLHFEVTGVVPDEAMTRAIDLSRRTYCSVSNTLDPELDVQTSFAISTP